MSIGSSIKPTTRGRRKPRLKVFSGTRRPARHRAVWGNHPADTIIEFWTEAEWEMLADWERPSGAAHFPGHGYVSWHMSESRDEHDEVAAEYSVTLHQHEARFGD